MILMLRAIVLATVLLVIPRPVAGQPLTVLHIKVALLDAERKPIPVPHHALLVSENPASASPRRIVTALDGTVDVRLRPGNYTVESDRPFAFQGKAYQWTQAVDIVAGRDALLELTAGNAEIEPVTAATTSTATLGADPSALLIQWQDSVVALWTPTTHGSGFVIDATGLIATNQRVIGTATSVEVQITSVVKVAGRVLVADPLRDVAVLRIDPKVLASVHPVPLGCTQGGKPPIVTGQKIFTIGTPLRDLKGITSGTVDSVEPDAVLSDFGLATGSTGGPVFAADGGVVGITSVVEMEGMKDTKDVTNQSQRGDSRVVRLGNVCAVVASAEKKMNDPAPPDGTHLPVEPTRPFPKDALEYAAKQLAVSLNQTHEYSTEFDNDKISH
jgi:S1-C subfamily serine protease